MLNDFDSYTDSKHEHPDICQCFSKKIIQVF